VEPRRDGPRSRQWGHHRRAIAKAARIDAVNLTTGQVPTGNQAAPSMRQLSGVWGWLTKVQPIDDGLPLETPLGEPRGDEESP
jgi:hypothetical protein